MNRCQHGQKITKFCITQHCHHKESAGCDYCIRRYHFHLTNTLLLSEADIESLIKNLTLPTDIKFKARNLQEAAIDYLRNVKIVINSWIDQAQNSIADRLGYPTLRKQGLLTTYNRLKQKEYRKINARELRVISQFAKTTTPQSLKRQQLAGYFEEVDWTMSVAAALEQVAAEVTKLPQLKEGQASTQVVSRAKLNQIYESILREKDRKDVQRKNTSPQINNGNSSSQGFKLQENLLLKRRQSAEKKGFDKGELASQFKEIIERKVLDTTNEETRRPNYSIDREISGNEETNNNNETIEEKSRGIRRRRSSIDDKFDYKFGATNEEKAKEARQIEQRKRRIVEKIEHQRKLSQDKLQKKEDSKPKIQRQYSQRAGKEEDSIMGNLLNLKLANKRQQLIKKQEENSFTNQTGQDPTKITQTQYIDMQKSEVLSSKASESNYLGVVELLINNILPPLPPTVPKTNQQDTYVQKVVKIPVMMSHVADQIQSPIFKTKKRQQDKQSAGSPFGIVLMPTVDKVIEKLGESPLTPISQTRAMDQSSFPAFPRKGSDSKEQKPQKQKQKDDLIVLQKNEKNSLLLFSQALKCPGDRAIQLLKAALKYSPSNLSAAEYLSYLYLQGGKSKQCIEVCQSILVQIQDTPEEFQLTLHLHNNKAAALNQLGRYSQSIMILQKCLRFRRKHYFYKNLGDAYFCLGIPEKAAMNYDKAIKLDPQSDEAFYNLAVTQFIQQQYTSAKLNISQALKIQPKNQSYVQLQQQIEKRIINLAM